MYYLLTLPAYGFYWFSLASRASLPEWYEPAAEVTPEFVTVVARTGLRDLGRPTPRRVLENDALPEFLNRQRCFAGESEGIEHFSLTHLFALGSRSVLMQVKGSFRARPAQRYSVPLGLSAEDIDSGNPAMIPYALARLRRGQKLWALVDATADPRFAY